MTLKITDSKNNGDSVDRSLSTQLDTGINTLKSMVSDITSKTVDDTKISEEQVIENGNLQVLNNLKDLPQEAKNKLSTIFGILLILFVLLSFTNQANAQTDYDFEVTGSAFYIPQEGEDPFLPIKGGFVDRGNGSMYIDSNNDDIFEQRYNGDVANAFALTSNVNGGGMMLSVIKKFGIDLKTDPNRFSLIPSGDVYRTESSDGNVDYSGVLKINNAKLGIQKIVPFLLSYYKMLDQPNFKLQVGESYIDTFEGITGNDLVNRMFQRYLLNLGLLADTEVNEEGYQIQSRLDEKVYQIKSWLLQAIANYLGDTEVLKDIAINLNDTVTVESNNLDFDKYDDSKLTEMVAPSLVNTLDFDMKIHGQATSIPDISENPWTYMLPGNMEYGDGIINYKTKEVIELEGNGSFLTVYPNPNGNGMYIGLLQKTGDSVTNSYETNQFKLTLAPLGKIRRSVTTNGGVEYTGNFVATDKEKNEGFNYKIPFTITFYSLFGRTYYQLDLGDKNVVSTGDLGGNIADKDLEEFDIDRLVAMGITSGNYLLEKAKIGLKRLYNHKKSKLDTLYYNEKGLTTGNYGSIQELNDFYKDELDKIEKWYTDTLSNIANTIKI